MVRDVTRLSPQGCAENWPYPRGRRAVGMGCGPEEKPWHPPRSPYPL